MPASKLPLLIWGAAWAVDPNKATSAMSAPAIAAMVERLRSKLVEIMDDPFEHRLLSGNGTLSTVNIGCRPGIGMVEKVHASST